MTIGNYQYRRKSVAVPDVSVRLASDRFHRRFLEVDVQQDGSRCRHELIPSRKQVHLSTGALLVLDPVGLREDRRTFCRVFAAQRDLAVGAQGRTDGAGIQLAARRRRSAGYRQRRRQRYICRQSVALRNADDIDAGLKNIVDFQLRTVIQLLAIMQP